MVARCKPFTQAQDDTILLLWSDRNCTTSAIAAKVGTHLDRLRGRARELGLGNRQQPFKPDDWTEAMVITLKAMHAEGRSARAVGKAVGVTKSAVLGKIHRLGMSVRPVPAAPKGVKRKERDPDIGDRKGRKDKQAPKSRPIYKAGAGVTVFEQSPPVKPLRIVGEAAWRPLEGSKPRPWTERTYSQCAWPVGPYSGADQLSCCQPVDRRGVCAEHAAIAFVAPVVRLHRRKVA